MKASDNWTFSNDGSTEFILPTSTTDLAEGTNLYLNGAGTTDNLAEGSANLWYTDARTLSSILNGNVKLKQFSETTVSAGNKSGSASFDLSAGTIQSAELVGNLTGISFTNFTAGSSVTLLLNQDSVGSRILDLTSSTTVIGPRGNLYLTLKH